MRGFLDAELIAGVMRSTSGDGGVAGLLKGALLREHRLVTLELGHSPRFWVE